MSFLIMTLFFIQNKSSQSTLIESQVVLLIVQINLLVVVLHVFIYACMCAYECVKNGFSKTNDVKNSTNNDSHDNSGYIQGSSKASVLEKERLSD